MRNKSTCLKEIANELNVSINTVSRALRDCDDISKATKELVRKKAYELGYLPNGVAQYIKRKNEKLIAIVVDSFKNLYFNAMCETLSKICQKENYDFTLIYTPKNTMHEDVIKQCVSQRVDGIISFCQLEDDVIVQAKFNNIPIVFVGRYAGNEKVNQVHPDDVQGGIIAANYLLHYHKIDKFLYYGLKEFKNSIDRFEAFKKAIEENLPTAKIEFVDVSEDVDVLQYIYNDYFGIFCYNDEYAYQLLSNLNVKMPNVRRVFPKLHIIGFDCLNKRVKGVLDLTSIDFDYEVLGKEVINILKNLFDEPECEVKSVVVPVFLHQRVFY